MSISYFIGGIEKSNRYLLHCRSKSPFLLYESAKNVGFNVNNVMSIAKKIRGEYNNFSELFVKIL